MADDWFKYSRVAFTQLNIYHVTMYQVERGIIMNFFLISFRYGESIKYAHALVCPSENFCPLYH